MYFYIYDSFLQKKKFEKEVSRIETRMTDLGINGNIAKLNILRDIGEIVQDAIQRGSETIVTLGDDQTISKAINVLALHDIVLGIIPIGQGSHRLAEILGVPYGESACEIISRRVIQEIDLGQANGHFFLSSIQTESADVFLEGEEGYRIRPLSKTSIVMVSNVNPLPESIRASANKLFFNPTDGILEAVVTPPAKTGFLSSVLRRRQHERLSDYTILPIQRIKIKSPSRERPVTVMADGKKVLKTPVDVVVAAKKLRVIVGKSRSF